jgi:hypothetical protein
MFALTVSCCKPASQLNEIFGFCGASIVTDERARISKKKVFRISATRWQQHTSRATEICATFQY